MWTDEGASIYTASDPHVTAIFDKLEENHHPPLYFIALGRWELMVGSERIALRMLTILGGMLTVALVYRLGRDWLGHTAALYGTLLFAVSDIAVHYAQQVRHYGWLVLAVVLMSLLFLRVLRRPAWGRVVAYGFSVAFMLYTQYLGLMVLALQGLFGVFLWRAPLRDKGRLVAAWVLGCLVLTIPWLIEIIQHVGLLLNESGLSSRPGVAGSSLDSLVEVVNLLANNQSALVVGLFALAVAALARRWRWTTPGLARAYLVLLGGGLFVAMFVMNIWVRVLTPRTMVYLTPGLLLVVGYGFTLLRPAARRALALAAVVLSLASTDIVQPRLASDAAAERLAADYSPGDLVILETGYDDNAVQYEVELALDDPQAEIIRTLPWRGNRGGVRPVVPEIRDELEASPRVWLVEWFLDSQAVEYLDDPANGFYRVIEEEVSVGEYEGLFGDDTLWVALYERPDLSGEPTPFGDLFALHDALLPPLAYTGRALHVDLWWSALAPPPLDYSVGVFLLDATGAARAEHNGPPGALPTSQWTPGVLTFDRHTLALPSDLAPGEYTVAVNAYWFGDLVPLEANGEALYPIGSLRVEAAP